MHEVWLELVSGTRVLVGSDLPDVSAANAVARRWRERAETEPDAMHEVVKGCIVRGSAIIAIKAQAQPRLSKVGTALKVAPRDGVWL